MADSDKQTGFTSGKHIIVIDPAIFNAEIENYNFLSRTCPFPTTYHLPALHGMNTLGLESLDSAAGIVVFGSGASVHDGRPWQKPLEEWINLQIERGIPTLAICYGHQMLAKMYGGQVQYAHPEKIKYTGFREIELVKESIFSQVKGSLLVSHNEIVVSVPDCMEVIGKSPEVAVDAMAHKKLPVWSFQSHPEATNAFRTNRNMPAVPESEYAYGRKILSEFFQFCRNHHR